MNKIVYVNHGIANNFGNVIELHKDLKKYPKLKKLVLKHELSHTNKVISKKDLSIDFTPDIKLGFSLFLFCLFRPSTWIDFLPIYYTKERGWLYDLNVSLIYFSILLIILALLFIK